VELVSILHVLWGRRIIVALGIFVAVAAGLLAGRASAGSGSSGVGVLRMVLDTTDSQLVAAAPKGADTLSMRASWLADSLATDEGRAAVARAAAVPEDQLLILGPAATREPMIVTPLVRGVSEATSASGASYIVNLTANEVTPIITIEAHGPDASQAAKLAQAAAAGLRTMLVSGDGTQSRGFELDTAAPVRTEEMVSGSRRSVAMLGAALVIFVGWCVCVVLGVGIAQTMRRLGHAARRT